MDLFVLTKIKSGGLTQAAAFYYKMSLRKFKLSQMSRTSLYVAFFIALWLPVMGAVQIITAYERNKYKKNPKLKEYKWGIINCVGSAVLYSYLFVETGWAVAIVGVAAIIILLFMLIFG